MVEFTWHTTPVPDDTQVRQVYGFLFVDDGRLLIRVDGHKHSLPGGRPESGETTYAAVLRREALEEVTVDIDKPYYLGYQQANEHDGTPPYAQIRMIARITAVYPAAPDPDNGRTYHRLLVHPRKAGDLLNWGQVGHQQATAAAQAAVTVLGLPGDGLPADTHI